MSERDLILNELLARPGSTARELLAVLRQVGLTKKAINAVLYAAVPEGVVSRSEDSPPRWTHSQAQQSPGGASEKEVVDLYLQRTGAVWSEAQVSAALESPNVHALREFTHNELAAAFDRAQGEEPFWHAWLVAARAIRSENIRL